MTPLDYLAAYRLTRLATEDALLHHPREAVVRWAYAQTGHPTTTAPAGGWAEQARAEGPDAPKLATLATCSWCASVWVVAGVLAARRVAPRTWGMLSRVLAGSAVVGLLGGLER